jgi:hypothetical protein
VVRGTANADRIRWTLSHRYIEGVIDRATHRTVLMRRLAPNLQAGVEINEQAGEIGPLLNWRAVSETRSRPAVILGTSSDRIGTPSGQSYYVTASKSLHHAIGVPVAPYVGLSYSEYEHRWLVPWGWNVSFGGNWSGMFIHDGVNSHLSASYGWDRFSLTLLSAFRRHFGINVSVAF